MAYSVAVQTLHNLPMQSPKILLTLTLITFAIIGCGQTGPLYLPDAPEPAIESADDKDAEKADSAKKEGTADAKNP